MPTNYATPSSVLLAFVAVLSLDAAVVGGSHGSPRRLQTWWHNSSEQQARRPTAPHAVRQSTNYGVKISLNEGQDMQWEESFVYMSIPRSGAAKRGYATVDGAEYAAGAGLTMSWTSFLYAGDVWVSVNHSSSSKNNVRACCCVLLCCSRCVCLRPASFLRYLRCLPCIWRRIFLCNVWKHSLECFFFLLLEEVMAFFSLIILSYYSTYQMQVLEEVGDDGRGGAIDNVTLRPLRVAASLETKILDDGTTGILIPYRPGGFKISVEFEEGLFDTYVLFPIF